MQFGKKKGILYEVSAQAYEKAPGLCAFHMIVLRYREVKIMKEGIHPKYQKVTVTCVCGNTFVTGSTKKELRVEICSKCHPYFTGKQKLVDAGGRVDRFKKRYGM